MVILDDRPARRLADALGIPLIGTLGIVVAGKRRGLLPEVRPLLDALGATGFHVASDLMRQVLDDAGEGE
jgi:uncharacterized protein